MKPCSDFHVCPHHLSMNMPNFSPFQKTFFFSFLQAFVLLFSLPLMFFIPAFHFISFLFLFLFSSLCFKLANSFFITQEKNIHSVKCSLLPPDKVSDFLLCILILYTDHSFYIRVWFLLQVSFAYLFLLLNSKVLFIFDSYISPLGSCLAKYRAQ